MIFDTDYPPLPCYPVGKVLRGTGTFENAMKRYLLITCWILLLFFTSCSPRIVEHLVVQRDTTYLSSHVRDSVYLRDSVYVKEYVKGDTVRITQYVERWRERTREVHDTTMLVRADSVAVERIKEVKVDKPLPVGKRLRLWAFFPLLLLALVGWRKEIWKVVRMIL